jgi:hypothetical protein
MLEVRDEMNTSLFFGCLITHICLQFVTNNSDSGPRSRILDPLGDGPQPPLVPVDTSTATSSSQDVPP